MFPMTVELVIVVDGTLRVWNWDEICIWWRDSGRWRRLSRRVCGCRTLLFLRNICSIIRGIEDLLEMMFLQSLGKRLLLTNPSWGATEGIVLTAASSESTPCVL